MPLARLVMPKNRWRMIWNVLHGVETKSLTYEDARMALALLEVDNLIAATLLYVNARDGYIVKRYW